MANTITKTGGNMFPIGVIYKGDLYWLGEDSDKLINAKDKSEVDIDMLTEFQLDDLLDQLSELKEMVEAHEELILYIKEAKEAYGISPKAGEPLLNDDC
jgi:hypothetical protein